MQPPYVDVHRGCPRTSGLRYPAILRLWTRHRRDLILQLKSEGRANGVTVRAWDAERRIARSEGDAHATKAKNVRTNDAANTPSSQDPRQPGGEAPDL
jgi:hypothetical protein